MNARLTNKIRNRLSKTASVLFVVVSAALAVSALTAQALNKATTTRHIPDCLANWPPSDQTQKDQLREAFETALHDSAMDNDSGKALRKDLLTTKNNFELPKKRIKEILDKQHPGNNITFPSDEVIIFYEEEPEASPPPTRHEKHLTVPFYHPNHCYTVLYLDPVGSVTAGIPIDFRAHVMCCYDPY
jgi:hypothetical protein